jgi:hypothetical protein
VGRAARARYEEAYTADRFTADIGQAWRAALTGRESEAEAFRPHPAEAVRP